MDLLPRRLDVVRDLGVGVRRAVHVREQLGAVLLRPEQVVELEAELLREVADLAVPLVDQLAAALDDLAVGERPRSVQQRPPIRSAASWISAA